MIDCCGFRQVLEVLRLRVGAAHDRHQGAHPQAVHQLPVLQHGADLPVGDGCRRPPAEELGRPPVCGALTDEYADGGGLTGAVDILARAST